MWEKLQFKDALVDGKYHHLQINKMPNIPSERYAYVSEYKVVALKISLVLFKMIGRVIPSCSFVNGYGCSLVRPNESKLLLFSLQ